MTYFTDRAYIMSIYLFCAYVCHVYFLCCFFFFYRITRPRQKLLLSFHQVCKVCLLSSSHGSTGRSWPWWRCCSQFCTIEPVDPFQQPLIARSFLSTVSFCSHCGFPEAISAVSVTEYILVSPLTLTSPKQFTHFQSISLAISFRLSGCSIHVSIQLLILQLIFSHLY